MSQAPSIRIADRTVGGGAPCFVIAEAGVNHNGDVDLAHKLVDVAADCGADAVKFQTFQAEKLVSAHADKAAYQKRATGAAESQLAMLQRLELPYAEHEGLKAHCEQRGVIFLSTPFEDDSADFLDQLGVAAFKLPSGELTNLPFLAHVARKGRPMILSTGMAVMAEVEAAVAAVRANGDPQLALLHCTSAYPADPASANLNVLHTMANAFGVPVGYSDHTEGEAVTLAAAALGAAVIEKHFTLDRAMAGPDHAASLEPDELKTLIAHVRVVESAMGDGVKAPSEIESDTRAVARKSVVAACDVDEGAVLTEDMLTIMRPGTGIPPGDLSTVVGRRATVSIAQGTPVTWDMLSGEGA